MSQPDTRGDILFGAPGHGPSARAKPLRSFRARPIRPDRRMRAAAAVKVFDRHARRPTLAHSNSGVSSICGTSTRPLSVMRISGITDSGIRLKPI